MPAQQHLAARSAVEEDHGRRGLRRLVGRQEKLSVNLEAVGAGEDHLLWRDHVLEREIGGNRGRGPGRGSRSPRRIDGVGGPLRSERRNALPAGDHSMPGPEVSATGAPPATATFQRWRRSGIALVGREHDLALAGGKVDVFHFESARGEQRGFSAFRGNGIEMRPAVALPGEDDAAAVGPQQLVPGGHFAEHAAGAGGGAPDFAARAGLHGGHADGPRLAASGAARERPAVHCWGCV